MLPNLNGLRPSKPNLWQSLIEQVYTGLTPTDPLPTLAKDAPPLVAWIQSEFYIPETGGPMPLYPYQVAMLEEATRTDASGRYLYDLVLWSDIKKSAKSTIAAAVILYRALFTPWGSFKIVANDLEQADSRVFFYLIRAIELNPKISARCVVKRAQHKVFITDNHATIQAVPIDPSGEAGANDDMMEWTELHGAKSKAQEKMWSEMTVPPTKHGYAQRWIDTYAGFSGEAPILERLYEQIVKQGERLHLPLAPDLEVFRNQRMIALWNKVPRLPWQTKEYYASEATVLPVNEFNRIHGNEWGSSTAKFVPGEWWEACKQLPLPALNSYKEIVLAMDAAVSGDCFGIVGVSRSGDKVITRYSRKWTPPPGGKLVYSNVDNPADPAYPEGELRRLCKDYTVIAVGYDPYQLHHLATSLKMANIAHFREFNQGGDRLEADKQLYDLIRDRRFLHDGDLDLTEHVQNANAKTENEKMRIIKRNENLKIDLCVCASMAAELALKLLPE